MSKKNRRRALQNQELKSSRYKLGHFFLINVNKLTLALIVCYVSVTSPQLACVNIYFKLSYVTQTFELGNVLMSFLSPEKMVFVFLKWKLNLAYWLQLLKSDKLLLYLLFWTLNGRFMGFTFKDGWMEHSEEVSFRCFFF